MLYICASAYIRVVSLMLYIFTSANTNVVFLMLYISIYAYINVLNAVHMYICLHHCSVLDAILVYIGLHHCNVLNAIHMYSSIPANTTVLSLMSTNTGLLYDIPLVRQQTVARPLSPPPSSPPPPPPASQAWVFSRPKTSGCITERERDASKDVDIISLYISTSTSPHGHRIARKHTVIRLSVSTNTYTPAVGYWRNKIESSKYLTYDI